jgi:hypothetical protein
MMSAKSRGFSTTARSAIAPYQAWVLCILLLVATRALAIDPTADATAKFLAGLPVEGTALESFSSDPVWTEHAAEFDRAWARLEQLQLSKIRAWAPQFLGEVHQDSGTMFYMFSGPDFLYANAFFPNANTYILCGTEPVGPIPNVAGIPREVLPSALGNLRKSLDSLLNWSFFITKDMKLDLTQTQLSGTLPLFYIFIARAGYTIDSVASIALDRNGNFIMSGKASAPGVKVVFSAPDRPPQTLYYFTSDLGNDGIKSNPGFIKFCRQQGVGVSLLKAASYLMHEEGFSQVREFLLTHSKVILQDDSGIPRRFFDDQKWSIRYCGQYAGPIEVFKKYQQPDLMNWFARSAPAPLVFGFGYQWHPSRASLMIATPRAADAVGPTPAAIAPPPAAIAPVPTPIPLTAAEAEETPRPKKSPPRRDARRRLPSME